jgi:hypothetical protein
VTRFFGVQRGVIQSGAQLGFLAALRQDSQLLLRAVVLPGEAEEFKKKRAAPGIGRVIAEVRRQGGLRVAHLAGIEQLFRRHEKGAG